MTPGPVDAYLSRLERELRHRGLESSRIVEEAREHLVDAAEDGRQRGLSVDAAEREACERFGAPETVAAQVVPGRDRMLNRFVAVVGTAWQRKWWMLAPTVLTAVVTSVLSYHLLPTRYRSETTVHIVSPRVPAEYVRPTATESSRARFQQISQSLLSRARLERIISDLGLYLVEQERTPLSDVVLQMRRDITISFLASEQAQDGNAGAFHVSVVSSDPRTAMKITERLASMIVQENLRERETQAAATNQFIASQIEDVRSRLVDYEHTLENLRTRKGRLPLSQADLLPYAVLQERYRTLLTKSEDSRIAANLQHRQIGEQFRVIDAARLPDRPLGPSRFGVNVAGTFAGLGLGLVVVGVRSRSKKRPAEAEHRI